MAARVLMVMGTHSHVGKSVLVTALCRIFARSGLRVAPFKAQNIALNAGVTPDGREIGRSTFLQAEAAGVPPRAEMNPLLIKPETAGCSQIVLLGRPFARMDESNWRSLKPLLWVRIKESLDRLREDYDLVVLEGAGSPAEINLKQDELDVANMGIASYARAPVLLVGDINLGGVFAALVGTMMLLEPSERELVRGFVINKLRGDPRQLGKGLELLRERAFGVPTLGVIPYLPDLGIAAEDGAVLEERRERPAAGAGERRLRICVLLLPHISNFDDFDSLAAEPGVEVGFVDRPEELRDAAAVVLPGTKTTLADLAWLRRTGLAAAVQRLAAAGTAVVGICGGYQMLGRTLSDPLGAEAERGAAAPGLDLLDVETTFAAGKRTEQVDAVVRKAAGPFAALTGEALRAYEIHMGTSRARTGSGSSPLWELGVAGSLRLDGAIDEAGLVWGTYLHGIFDNDVLRHAWLRSLGWHGAGRPFDRRQAYDRLADHVQAHLDMPALERLIAGPAG